jgi:SnoaL-like domain
MPNSALKRDYFLLLGELAHKVQVLEIKVAQLSDAREIANLQGRYIYYLQAHQYERIVEMFACKEEVSVEMDNLGKFIGRDKVRDVFLKVLQPLYTMKGAMGLHMLTTPVIEVHPDGRRAWGMWHTLGCNTQPDFVGEDTEMTADPVLIAMWQQGKYFVDFVKEDGEWKWKDFRWYVNFRTPFNQGWVKQPITGNLSVVAKLIPGCPPPDGPADYRPFSPDELTPYLPIPPRPFGR